MLTESLEELIARRDGLSALLDGFEKWIIGFGICVVIGVGGESSYGIRTWWINRRLHVVQQSIDQLRQAEIARLAASTDVLKGDLARASAEANTEAEKLRLDIAKSKESAKKAELQAAEANLELARFKTPRTLSSEQQKRISDKVKIFPGLKFDMALTPEPEPQNLLPQILGALRGAGWDALNWAGGDLAFERPGQPNAGIVIMTGVIIQMHPEDVLDFQAPASVLASALKDEGVMARAEAGLGPGIKNTNTKALHILIGVKPQ